MLPPQGQAQECLLEKSMLDNRKSFLVARISAQVSFWGIFSVLNSCHSCQVTPGDELCGPCGIAASPEQPPAPPRQA